MKNPWHGEPKISVSVEVIGGGTDLPVIRRSDGTRVVRIGATATNRGIFAEGYDLNSGEMVRSRLSDFYFPQPGEAAPQPE